ncbi:type II/IV secretion system protein [Candidatus Gottesmanbacteria bacterium]|nr:type II/IV secretion system protein [Candidatus Gottesmanbacteria bacterium]
MITARSVEDILAESKKLTPEQVNLVKLEAVNSGKPVEAVIKDHGFASDQDILEARATILGIPFVDLTAKAILPEVLNLVPESVARRFNVVPFELDKKSLSLSVAMADPLDINIISFLEKKTGQKIRPFLAAAGLIKSTIDDRYNQSLSTEVSAALSETPTETTEASDISKLGNVIRDAPVAKIAASLLEFAMKARASDIHIEPLEDRTRVRYRIDGILYEKLVLPTRIHDALVSRIKIMAELKIDEKRVPQDGRIEFKSGNNAVDIRVSTLPTAWGEKIVMRLLPKSGGVPTLVDLGLRGLAKKNLEVAILRPHGIILICGPTGSGKTTTLYAVLSKINSTKVNIVTLEDPVEYQIPGVNQVQINPAAGLTFATGLRAFLRQDPNIILVGEIRDKETTELAVQAALTGHLVFSTLHTSSAAGALPRLLDLGAEPFLLASSLNAVVGQRILRKICGKCKEGYEVPDIMVQDMKSVLGNLLPPDKLVNGKLTFYKGKGW